VEFGVVEAGGYVGGAVEVLEEHWALPVVVGVGFEGFLGDFVLGA